MKRGFNQYMRRLNHCPESLEELCKRNFMYNCNKAVTGFLLRKNHLYKKFEFNNVTFKFMGFFNNNNCLLKNKDGYYECNLNFAQNGFKLFYKNFVTQLHEPYLKSELKYQKKKIIRLINQDYE